MAENNEIRIIQKEDYQKGYLTLPFDETQFKDFITGLLGSPQTITKRIRGNFEIHLKDLQNVHDLINQRIAQQNNGHLIQLKTKIFYSDESSVMLGSYEELVTYNEVKPIISEAVRMNWSYLIQFVDKKAPEKQEIELLIISTPLRNVIEEDDIPTVYSSTGVFRISIEHTARSWGADIESLLTNQINSILYPPVKWRGYVKKHSGRIGLLVGILFFLSSVIGIYLNTKTFNQGEVQKVKELISKNVVDVNKKTDYILQYLASNEQNFYFIKTLLFVVISIFIAIILGAWVESLADNKNRSYVIMTREALKMRDKSEEKRKHTTMLFFVSILVSIVTGIFSNYIFTWLTSK